MSGDRVEAVRTVEEACYASLQESLSRALCLPALARTWALAVELTDLLVSPGYGFEFIKRAPGPKPCLSVYFGENSQGSVFELSL